MSFDPVWWALARKKAGCSGGGGSSGGNTPSVGDNFPIGDGNTHIWISLAEGRTSPMLGVGVNGTVTVDWGDGSAPDTLTGTNVDAVKYTPNHEYGKAGDYVITLTVDGTLRILGDAAGSYLLRYAHGSLSTEGRTYAYLYAVKKVELGENASVNYYSLSSLSALSDAVFSDGIETLNQNLFLDCFALKSFCIPSNAVEIPLRFFMYCYSLANVVVPPSVTSVAAAAFGNCKSLRYVDFSQHTAVPALSDTIAFTGIPSDCEIRVPAALVDEWKAATNWATYADYIVGV